MFLTICPPFRCWFCPPANALSIDYISLLRDGNKVWCGTCGNFLGHDIVAPEQSAGLLKSLILDSNMHVYRKPTNNVPVRASGQDVNITALDLIDRAYTRFNIGVQWFHLQDPEQKLCVVKEGTPIADQPLFADMLPEPVKLVLRKFPDNFVMTQSTLSGKNKLLRLEGRYAASDTKEPKCLVVRFEVRWPDDLLNPPPEPPKHVITLAAAKKIFFKAAKDCGVPTPTQFPRATADPQKLTAALQAFNDATRKSMLGYLPDGKALPLTLQTEWSAKILRAAGWKVVVAPNELSYCSNYPDENC